MSVCGGPSTSPVYIFMTFLSLEFRTVGVLCILGCQLINDCHRNDRFQFQTEGKKTDYIPEEIQSSN